MNFGPKTTPRRLPCPCGGQGRKLMLGAWIWCGHVRVGAACCDSGASWCESGTRLVRQRLPCPHQGQGGTVWCARERCACGWCYQGALVRADGAARNEKRCPARAKGRAGSVWCAREETRAPDAARTRKLVRQSEKWCAKTVPIQMLPCPRQGQGRVAILHARVRTWADANTLLFLLAFWHASHP